MLTASLEMNQEDGHWKTHEFCFIDTRNRAINGCIIQILSLKYEKERKSRSLRHNPKEQGKVHSSLR